MMHTLKLVYYVLKVNIQACNIFIRVGDNGRKGTELFENYSSKKWVLDMTIWMWVVPNILIIV